MLVTVLFVVSRGNVDTVSLELSILIATVPQREGLLSRLLACLEPQLDDRRVETIVHKNPDKPMGRKFNELYRAANGRLSVQIDDDDLVTEFYVEDVLAVSEGHDFVGYKIEYTVNGKPVETYTINPLRQRQHVPYGPDAGTLRGLTPKCPMLTERARRFHFNSFPGSDWYWIADVTRDGFPFNPTFLDQSMYWYDDWPHHSLGTRPEDWTPQREVPVQAFDWHKFTWME
jgi:hypothetical protein